MLGPVGVSMVKRVKVLGVHPITAKAPVHLIEIRVDGPIDTFDFGAVSQEDVTQPRLNWQVAYEECLLEKSAEHARFTFFFHFLAEDRPLLTSFGPASLPVATPVPDYLASIEYDEP